MSWLQFSCNTSYNYARNLFRALVEPPQKRKTNSQQCQKRTNSSLCLITKTVSGIFPQASFIKENSPSRKILYQQKDFIQIFRRQNFSAMFKKKKNSMTRSTLCHDYAI